MSECSRHAEPRSVTRDAFVSPSTSTDEPWVLAGSRLGVVDGGFRITWGDALVDGNFVPAWLANVPVRHRLSVLAAIAVVLDFHTPILLKQGHGARGALATLRIVEHVAARL